MATIQATAGLKKINLSVESFNCWNFQLGSSNSEHWLNIAEITLEFLTRSAFRAFSDCICETLTIVSLYAAQPSGAGPRQLSGRTFGLLELSGS